ncbi:hypothetical protein J4219_00465 [Candidatus Woesearchaeota archaeon]|nr:hypothetical protein [Candidatus Woesearchaeota archaeon]
MGLEEDLVNIGLLPGESKVYMAGLALGPARVQDIAERAKSSRTYTYEILKALTRKGLASILVRSGVCHYDMAPAEKLCSIISQRIDQLKTTGTRIKKELPLIKNQTNSLDRTRIELYEGREGLKTVLDALTSPGSTILLLGSFEKLLLHNPNFIIRRIRENSSLCLLTERTSLALKFKNRDKKELRNTRFLSIALSSLPTLTYISNDKVAIISFHGEKEDDVRTLLFEDPGIADTCKNIFKLLWQTANE